MTGSMPSWSSTTMFVLAVSGSLKRWYDAGLVKIKSPRSGEDYVAAFASGECQMT